MKHDELWEKKLSEWNEIPNEQFFIEPIGTDLSNSGALLRAKEEEATSAKEPEAVMSIVNDFYRVQDYRRTCRGMVVVCYTRHAWSLVFKTPASVFQPRTDVELPRICYLKRDGHPFNLLSPVKVEVLAGKPLPVLMFHDMATEGEIDGMMALARSSVRFRSEKLASQISKLFFISQCSLQGVMWSSKTKRSMTQRELK